MTQEKLQRELEAIFGKNCVSADKEVCQTASRDLCPENLLNPAREDSCASMVVQVHGPDIDTQIQRLIELSRSVTPKISIVARGGGSGVCGALRATCGEIVLDMSAVKKVSLISKPSTDVPGFIRVGAGASGKDIDAALESTGLTCGHYPASYYVSTFGGWVQCGASGQFAFKHGTIKNLVRLVEGVTGRGEHIVLEGDEIKNVFGMEGTTMIMTAGILPVFHMSARDGHLAFSFRDVQDTTIFLKSLSDMRSVFAETGVKIYAVRCYDFIDRTFIAKPHKKESSRSLWQERLGYFVERGFAYNGKIIQTALRALERRGQASWMGVIYMGAESAVKLLDAQKCIEALVLRTGGSMKPSIIAKTWHDNRFKLGYDKLSARYEAGMMVDTFDCTPSSWGDVASTYEEVREALSRFGIVGAHMSADLDGPYLYFTFATGRQSINLYHEVWASALHACIASGARTNHQHGIGKLKAGPLKNLISFANGRDWQERAIRAKKMMDPDSVLNPLNVF